MLANQSSQISELQDQQQTLSQQSKVKCCRDGSVGKVLAVQAKTDLGISALIYKPGMAELNCDLSPGVSSGGEDMKMGVFLGLAGQIA